MEYSKFQIYTTPIIKFLSTLGGIAYSLSWYLIGIRGIAYSPSNEEDETDKDINGEIHNEDINEEQNDDDIDLDNDEEIEFSSSNNRIKNKDNENKTCNATSEMLT